MITSEVVNQQRQTLRNKWLFVSVVRPKECACSCGQRLLGSYLISRLIDASHRWARLSDLIKGLEQVMGIEPTSWRWKRHVIAVIQHLHIVKVNYAIYLWSPP